jgi:UDP-N-acetyl-D-mannosaminuronate dehydrogenase
MVDHVAVALNSAKKAINGSRIPVLWNCLHQNMDDVRESSSVIFCGKGGVI